MTIQINNDLRDRAYRIACEHGFHDKDFFKNANIQFKEIDYSHIHAEKIDASKIKEVWK
jgi:hypothetical protein